MVCVVWHGVNVYVRVIDEWREGERRYNVVSDRSLDGSGPQERGKGSSAGKAEIDEPKAAIRDTHTEGKLIPAGATHWRNMVIEVHSVARS